MIIAEFIWFYKIGSHEPGLPPGPPTVPLLGNLYIFPTEYAHHKWLKVGPTTAIIITSTAAVKELMDKRSASTADRPQHYMTDVITGGLNMVLTRYSDAWKRAEAAQLMHEILHAPEVPFYTHVRRYSNSTILSITYGKRCPRYESPEATLFFEAQHLWELVLEPGAHPTLDLLPFLKHLPGVWKRLREETRHLQRKLYFGLLDEYLGGVLIEGGSDTMSSFLQSLILAFTEFPEAQGKAQEEINELVGDHRLPTLDDFTDLPYIQAVIKEVNNALVTCFTLRPTHRFRPVAPVAIPHGTLAAEKYCGYMIPKGATIFVNTYVYDELEVFNPDRYLLTEHGMKPGVDDEPLPQGILTSPRPFQCRITPQSEGKAKLIKKAFLDTEDIFVKLETGITAEDKEWMERYRAHAM
ncbi:cytochrome P450 [Armillaria novae-zelandiae]|uniref:Cytochrome P450 n=1 Tax=Armillaria novae-zelandiae TaxID=153914 RepID=A0AA39PIW5_9AGAR|nr:cytochrome P450 [Armillaria novae-zelandiae]